MSDVEGAIESIVDVVQRDEVASVDSSAYYDGPLEISHARETNGWCTLVMIAAMAAAALFL